MIETARLQLRPCQLEDLSQVHSLWRDEAVRRFLFDERQISLEEARSFIQASLETFEQEGYGLWLVMRPNCDQLIGFAGGLRSDGNCPNLVFGIHPDFWGQGYATEAAGAVLRYLIEVLKFDRIQADVDRPNLASIRVLEKLGMSAIEQTGAIGQTECPAHPLLYFEYWAQPSS